MLQHLSFETSATPAKWHYTPKHGSWLDLAESELGILSSQCLDRRIPDKQTLIDEIAGPQCQLHQFQVPRTNGLIPGRDVPVVIFERMRLRGSPALATSSTLAAIVQNLRPKSPA